MTYKKSRKSPLGKVRKVKDSGILPASCQPQPIRSLIEFLFGTLKACSRISQVGGEKRSGSGSGGDKTDYWSS